MSSEPNSSIAGKRRYPLAAIILIVLSCYLVVETTAYLIWLFRDFQGGWDLGGILRLNFEMSPTVVLPLLIIWAYYSKKPILYRRILAWVIRVIYVVIILALCDCCSICTRGRALFAIHTERSKGDFAYFGCPGYDICRFGSDQINPGLTIHFWHAPVIIDLRSHHSLIHWAWSSDIDD